MGYLETHGWLQLLISLSFYILIGPVAILVVTTIELVRLPVLLCLRAKYGVIFGTKKCLGQDQKRCQNLSESIEHVRRAQLTVAEPHLPISTKVILNEDSNIFMRFVSNNQYHRNRDSESLQEGLRSLINIFVDINPALAAFGTILRYKKSRLSDQDLKTRTPNFNIRIYISPRKAEQSGQNLRVVLDGGILDDLMDMCYDKRILKLKLHLQSFKTKKEDAKTEDLELQLGEMTSKEIVGTLNTEVDPGSTKYIFEDSDFGTLPEPHLVMDGSFCSLKLQLELIVDEKAIYGLKLPEWELIEKSILEEELHTDFLLVAGNGDKIPCHKVYLASRSPVFRQMFQSGMKESTENECTLENMSKEGVKSLLKYIYCFSVEDALQDPKIALELMQTGHKYDVVYLANSMKQIFIGKPAEWFNIDVALLLFMWSMKVDDFEDVTSKAVVVINRTWNEVKESSMYQERFIQNPKNLDDLHSWTLRLTPNGPWSISL